MHSVTAWCFCCFEAMGKGESFKVEIRLKMPRCERLRSSLAISTSEFLTCDGIKFMQESALSGFELIGGKLNPVAVLTFLSTYSLHKRLEKFLIHCVRNNYNLGYFHWGLF